MNDGMKSSRFRGSTKDVYEALRDDSKKGVFISTIIMSEFIEGKFD